MRRTLLANFPEAGRYCLILTVLVTPLIFNRATADVFNLTKLTILVVFGLSAFALWLSWKVESGSRFPRMRLVVAAAVFVASVGLSTIFSESPSTSIVGLYHRYGGLIPLLLYGAIFIATAGLYWRKPAGLDQIVWGIVTAALVMSAYIVIQAAGWDWFEWREVSGYPPPYPIGTMGNSNFAGGYLGIALPLVLYTALWRRDRWKWILLSGTVLTALAIFLAQSRGGMIAAGAGVAAMGIAYRDQIPRWLKAAAGIAVLAAVTFGFLLIRGPAGESADPPGDLRILATDTLTTRRFYWGTALQTFQAHPIIGTGPDTFLFGYPAHRSLEDGETLGLAIPDKPHSIYLEYAANSGAFALLSFLVLAVLGLIYAFRGASAPGPDRRRTAAFLGAFAAYLAQGVFSIDVPPIAFMGWLCLGAIAALADPGSIEARARPAQAIRKGNIRWAVHAGLAVALLSAIVLGSSPFRADLQAKARKDVSPSVQKPRFEKAIALNPLEPTYHSALALMAETAAARSRDRRQATEWMKVAVTQHQAAVAAQPRNIFLRVSLARTKFASALLDPELFPEAEREWRRLVAFDPKNLELRGLFSNMLTTWSLQTGDQDLQREALAEMKKIAAARPRSARTWLEIGKSYLALGELEQAESAIRRSLRLFPFSVEAKALLADIEARRTVQR